MDNNINRVKNCAGCFGCGDVCPKKAISYVQNEYGFFYPKVDKTKCINCGLCVKVCPQLNSKIVNQSNQKGFISYSKNNEIYNSSASGGIFSELALYFLNNNGLVYGASFDGLKVKHIKIDKIEDLEKIQRSKYIQSNAKGIYKDCKEYLNKGKSVLFSGTPCQISALKNYLGKEYDNLLTCDIVCHGVPSQGFFDKCIELENEKRKGKIIRFDFRYKTKKHTSPRNFRYIIEKNGKKIERIGNYYDFNYLVGFYKYLTLRDSCYECKYAKMNRIGDLTLGDYWDVREKYNKENGISMVVVNTKKGELFLDKIKDKVFLAEESMQLIKKGNETFNGPTKMPKERNDFMNLYTSNFNVAADKYLKVKHKFILRCYYGMPNFIKTIAKKVIHFNTLK